MKILIFGLPGAGKTTLVRASELPELHLDLGHNAFKSEFERSKFYQKLSRFTTGMLQLDCDYICDTYPEYFDVLEISQLPIEVRSSIAVVFLLPQSATEVYELVDRVGKRDGYDSEFYALYRKNGIAWWKAWLEIYKLWKNNLKCVRVYLKDIYQNEQIITVTKDGDKK